MQFKAQAEITDMRIVKKGGDKGTPLVRIKLSGDVQAEQLQPLVGDQHPLTAALWDGYGDPKFWAITEVKLDTELSTHRIKIESVSLVADAMSKFALTPRGGHMATLTWQVDANIEPNELGVLREFLKDEVAVEVWTDQEDWVEGSAA